MKCLKGIKKYKNKDLDNLFPWLPKNLNENRKSILCVIINEIGLGNFMLYSELIDNIIKENYKKASIEIQKINSFNKSFFENLSTLMVTGERNV